MVSFDFSQADTQNAPTSTAESPTPTTKSPTPTTIAALSTPVRTLSISEPIQIQQRRPQRQRYPPRY